MREAYKRAVAREREAIIALMKKDLDWASPNVAQYIGNLIKLIEKRGING